MKKIIALFAAVVCVASLAACGSKTKANNQSEQAAQQQSTSAQLINQPVPVFTYSQLRQNLIDVVTAEATGAQTTSFMFLQAGAGATGPLVHWCPSIGFPIPATDQLTNPDTVERHLSDHGGGNFTYPQQDPTGVYAGQTTGTNVICIGADGKPYDFYHEGFVSTVSGPAHWDTAKGEIVMDGTSSFNFSKAKK